MPEFTGTLTAPRQSSAPSSPTPGQMYYDTATSKLFFWNGTLWVSAAGGGGEFYEQASEPSSTTSGALWIDTDELPYAWASGIPLVSVLPATPQNGQEVYYLADAAKGVIWHLRYRVDSASTYKWEFVGGSEMISRAEAQVSTTSGTAVDLGGPTVVLPLSGTYLVSWGGMVSQTTAPAWVNILLDPIGAGADAQTVLRHNQGVVNVWSVVHRSTEITMAAGNLKLTYYQSSGGTANYLNRYLTAIPVRVG